MSRELSLANLEIYLDQATDPLMDEFNLSAVDAFCLLVKKEPELNVHATRILANKIQSQNVKESLYALDCLEECMDVLGTNFQIEINKFKFLNELIRLVSKKFLGDKTPLEIQNRILDILFTWTDKYPELSKIKEAYTMLRTQGVVHEPQKNVIAPSKKSTDSTLKLMESEKFKRLLQSRNQKDIEAANLMIQNMVRDNDRRIQIQNRRLMDLQSANENALLLKEMLDEIDVNNASDDMLSTIQEIYKNCLKLKPTVCRLAEESHDSESFMNKILETTDLMNRTIENYTAIIINKIPTVKTMKTTTNLLDVAESLGEAPKVQETSNGTLSELNDIFSTSETASPLRAQIDNILLTPQVMTSQQASNNSNIDIMALINSHKPANKTISDDLFGNFTDSSIKSPTKPTQQKVNEKPKAMLSELDSIVSGMKTKLLVGSEEESTSPIEEVPKPVNDDDVKNLICETPQSEVPPLIAENLFVPQPPQKAALKDIIIDLSNIQPSEIEAPRTILDEPKGLKVVVNFTKDRPAKDVVVLVISVMNQGSVAINNFTFDASVSKPCKLRILEASGRDLPAVKPFKPPTETIDQVVLLLNPTQQPVNMIAILTYNIQDDEDEEKVSIEVKDIPFTS
ncbi:ADP-ribosylation factor-binding protein GGA1 [Chironomus tepperi]|uniref:ADP-ribosylation factor-binding protein GGA1 n=1 Tax=Chironomus tepperi TaxID=113505 RepID=UPI00391F2E86